MLEDSPRMLQNEIGKSLCAILVVAVELFSALDILKRLMICCWNSQNDSGSGNLEATVSSLSYPVASEGAASFILLYINKDTVLYRGVLITTL